MDISELFPLNVYPFTLRFFMPVGGLHTSFFKMQICTIAEGVVIALKQNRKF